MVKGSGAAERPMTWAAALDQGARGLAYSSAPKTTKALAAGRAGVTFFAGATCFEALARFTWRLGRALKRRRRRQVETS
jgi:hypothetical protein